MNNNTTYKISVILPMHNRQEYISASLTSVLEQTLKEVEIVCIDDGSTDCTVHIVKEFICKHSNIKLIEQEHKGVGVARNIGIAQALGEFIFFMDSDDFFYSNEALKTLYKTAKSHKAYVCGGGMCKFDNGKIIKKYYGWLKDMAFEKSGWVNYEDYQFQSGFTRFIYQREFLLKHNLKFPNYVRYQDPPFFVNTMIAAEKFYAVSEIIYTYRVGHKRLSMDKKMVVDYGRGIRDVMEIALKNDFSKLYENVKFSLEGALKPYLYKLIYQEDIEAIELAHELNILMSHEEKKMFAFGNQAKEYIESIKKEADDFLKTIDAFEAVYIFGAGKVGMRTAEFIKKSGCNTLKEYIVTNISDNLPIINGIKVRALETKREEINNTIVLIALFKSNISEVIDALKEKGLNNYMIIHPEKMEFWNILIDV